MHVSGVYDLNSYKYERVLVHWRQGCFGEMASCHELRAVAAINSSMSCALVYLNSWDAFVLMAG